jgi:ribosomal protein S18 acetylase RimI-like enzyme
MNLPKKIVDLIYDEQIRQAGKFVPEGEEYLEKLAVNAELLSHDSLGQCLGFVFFYCNDPSRYSSYITLLMVSQASRKSGIGAALVRYVLTLTAQRGFKVCRLEVRKENAAAIKLYGTMGFCQLEDRGDKYLMEAKAS